MKVNKDHLENIMSELNNYVRILNDDINDYIEESNRNNYFDIQDEKDENTKKRILNTINVNAVSIEARIAAISNLLKQLNKISSYSL